MLIALAVPLAAAVNLVTIKHAGRSVDLIPAVLLGAIFAAAVTLPFALLPWPNAIAAEPGPADQTVVEHGTQ